MNITDVLRQEKNWVIIGDTSNPEKYANKIYNEVFIIKALFSLSLSELL